MARKRRSGGRRRGLRVTPTFIVKAAVGIAGLKMIMDNDPVGKAKFLASNPAALTRPDTYVSLAKSLGPCIVVAAAGPKVAGKFIQFATKAVPGSSKLANATIVRV